MRVRLLTVGVPLRIDNGGLALISLRFTFLLIASWLLGPS